MRYKTAEKYIDRIILFLLFFIPLYGFAILNSSQYTGWDAGTTMNTFSKITNNIFIWLLAIFTLLSLLNLFFILKRVLNGTITCKYFLIKIYPFSIIFFLNSFRFSNLITFIKNIVFWDFLNNEKAHKLNSTAGLKREHLLKRIN